MSVIGDVVKEEYNRLSQLIEVYDQKISQFPKGSLSRKIRKGHAYIYLSYRDHGKVRSDYLGKEDSEKVSELSAQIKKRHKYEEMRKKSLVNLKDVKRYMHVAER